MKRTIKQANLRSKKASLPKKKYQDSIKKALCKDEKQMKSFNNIAALIKAKRTEHPQCYSQQELANLLGFKGENFIASIEEAKCQVPLKTMAELSKILNICREDFIDAVMKDYEESLDMFFRQTFEDVNRHILH